MQSNDKDRIGSEDGATTGNQQVTGDRVQKTDDDVKDRREEMDLMLVTGQNRRIRTFWQVNEEGQVFYDNRTQTTAQDKTFSN